MVRIIHTFVGSLEILIVSKSVICIFLSSAEFKIHQLEHHSKFFAESIKYRAMQSYHSRKILFRWPIQLAELGVMRGSRGKIQIS